MNKIKALICITMLLSSIVYAKESKVAQGFSSLDKMEEYIESEKADYSSIEAENYHLFLIELSSKKDKNLNEVKAYLKKDNIYILIDSFSYPKTHFVGYTSSQNSVIVNLSNHKSKERKKLTTIKISKK